MMTEFLVGGGAMGDRVRGFRWEQTALGARADWPAPLRTAVNIVLGSNLPMAVLWGPRLCFICNDQYRLVGRDPEMPALGCSIRDDDRATTASPSANESIVAAVMERGESVLLTGRRLAMFAAHPAENGSLTASCCPVRTDDGSVAGALITVLAIATTQQARTQGLQATGLPDVMAICSYCKKIRDDDGGWIRLEAYISKRTAALFSHGMCPECGPLVYASLPRDDGAGAG
jgi:hypothetical protein